MRAALIAVILASSVIAPPLLAQNDPISLRVGKLEKEMTAVQRKVFPGGAGLQPEISGSAQSVNNGVGASTPVADLTARVDALEAQLKSLTGQVEQNGFRLRKLEDAMKATDGRLKALEPTAAATPTVGPNDVATPPTPVKPAAIMAKPPVSTPASTTKLTPPAPTSSKPMTSTKADPKRKALIDAVEIPDSGDSTEDAYAYGFRLWTAKLYPEAQVKLKEFVAKNPSHRLASYAQNLLGRAYLDEGKPALASVAFFDNYKNMPRGERAAESLYWLGIALNKLNKPADACKVYKEFDDVYGAKASADVKSKVAKGRSDAKCTA